MEQPDERRSQRLEELRGLIARFGDHAPLDRGLALVTSHEQPWLEPDGLIADLDALTHGLHVPDEADPIEAVARLNHHLFAGLGFTGDEDNYDAPHNSFLDRVLERRRGLPILLCIVYLEVGRRVGVGLEGINFPGHFLVAPTAAEPRFFVDPFAAGAVRRPDQLLSHLSRVLGRPVLAQEDAEQHLTPCSNRQTLVRVSNNLKASYLRRHDNPGALRAVDRLRILAPEVPEFRRDRALLLARLERPQEAVGELEGYLEQAPDARDAAELAAYLQRLKLIA